MEAFLYAVFDNLRSCFEFHSLTRLRLTLKHFSSLPAPLQHEEGREIGSGRFPLRSNSAQKKQTKIKERLLCYLKKIQSNFLNKQDNFFIFHFSFFI
ncbi:MAG: hypothetical protein LBR34_07290, partial [Prevotella sp.]|nr:hypothetical protein [Prevotella sp.]